MIVVSSTPRSSDAGTNVIFSPARRHVSAVAQLRWLPAGKEAYVFGQYFYL